MSCVLALALPGYKKFDTADLQINEILGKGGNGEVYAADILNNKEKYRIKCNVVAKVFPRKLDFLREDSDVSVEKDDEESRKAFNLEVSLSAYITTYLHNFVEVLLFLQVLLMMAA